MRHNLLYILTLLALTSCDNNKLQYQGVVSDSLITNDSISADNNLREFETTEIICDSVYKNKNYKLVLHRFDTINIMMYDSSSPNTILKFYKRINDRYSEIFRDSIFQVVQEVKFTDFNNDNMKDILVQNSSDVRSNWTYNLYLVDTLNDKLKRIKGFDDIKNPRFQSEYNLVDNYVNSGTNWTTFYKIKGDSVVNFDITIFDDLDDSGNNDENTYDIAYKKAIKTILTREQNSR